MNLILSAFSVIGALANPFGGGFGSPGMPPQMQPQFPNPFFNQPTNPQVANFNTMGQGLPFGNILNQAMQQGRVIGSGTQLPQQYPVNQQGLFQPGVMYNPQSYRPLSLAEQMMLVSNTKGALRNDTLFVTLDPNVGLAGVNSILLHGQGLILGPMDGAIRAQIDALPGNQSRNEDGTGNLDRRDLRPGLVPQAPVQPGLPFPVQPPIGGIGQQTLWNTNPAGALLVSNNLFNPSGQLTVGMPQGSPLTTVGSTPSSTLAF